MKVYSCPDAVAYPEPDYANYDSKAEEARQEAHKADLKAWLLANGSPGPRTGEILRVPRGDGYACYMYGDAPGAKACLIHLPYGDAWHSPDVEFLSKKEVLARLDREANHAKLFGGMTAAKP